MTCCVARGLILSHDTQPNPSNVGLIGPDSLRGLPWYSSQPGPRRCAGGKAWTKKNTPKLLYDDLNRLVYLEGGGFKEEKGDSEHGLKFVTDRKNLQSSSRFYTGHVEQVRKPLL